MKGATDLIARTRQRLNSLRTWRPGTMPRPVQLLLTVATTLALGLYADSLTGWTVLSKIRDLDHASPAEAQSWSALNYALLLIGGLPVAFLIWHWRDVNMRDQIENARKDINLKEFQEVQLRAAGALDEKLPLEAREQLQIAALHQLRTFLRGDYGDSFKRPAFELLLAGHAAAVFRIGVPEVQAQVAGQTRVEIQRAADALRARLTPIDRARMLIIRDEAKHIFTRAFPIDGRRFDLLDLSQLQFPERLGLRNSHFFGAELFLADFEGADLVEAHFESAALGSVFLKGATLQGAHLEGADLEWANLEAADLGGTRLDGANLSGAYLEGADLCHAHLEGANLLEAHLECADLSGVHLNGGHLYRANFEGADIRFAQFDDATVCVEAQFNADTQFGDHSVAEWSNLTEAERDEARAPWLARGMVRSDLPPPAAEEQPADPAPD